MGLDQAVEHIMEGMGALALHPDVREGIIGLESNGYRLLTLSNGSSRLAQKLFTDAGIGGSFERLLTVEDAAA